MKNTVSNTIFSMYLLYPTDRDDETNFYRLLQNYVNIGTEIYAYLIDWEKMDGLPKFRLYVPADHEVFIDCAYKSGFLTKEQISTVNRKIIKACNLVIVFGGFIAPAKSSFLEEVEYAKQEKIPIYTMPDLGPEAIEALKFAIQVVIKSGG